MFYNHHVGSCRAKWGLSSNGCCERNCFDATELDFQVHNGHLGFRAFRIGALFCTRLVIAKCLIFHMALSTGGFPIECPRPSLKRAGLKEKGTGKSEMGVGPLNGVVLLFGFPLNLAPPPPPPPQKEKNGNHESQEKDQVSLWFSGFQAPKTGHPSTKGPTRMLLAQAFPAAATRQVIHRGAFNVHLNHLLKSRIDEG